MKHLEAFENEHSLIEKYTKDKAYTVWAMGLYLNTSDLQQLADDYLTDASDDHKIDFLYFDEDEKTLLVVQGFHSDAVKQSAKANKAADLNAALAWLFTGEIERFNDFMRPKVEEIRQALADNKLQFIELIFAHNCGESKEVDLELKTAANFLNEHFNETAITVSYKELGNPSLESLFLKKTSNITITDNVECPYPVKSHENSADWNSVCVTITGEWLRELYLQYNSQLFSANYRGYLGESRNKINKGIKMTAERNPQNFWAFNNGITILTHSYDVQEGKVVLHGMSIINGAQTTGSLGQIPTTTSIAGVQLMARIIQCTNPDVIGSIIKFNNMQNRITSWDSYGNDTQQIELKREFEAMHYDYSIKRGFDNRDCILNIETIIQPLLAFNGKYRDAGRSKSTIFESNTLRSDAFGRANARHILFVSCLSAAIYSIKEENKQRMSQNAPSATDVKMFNLFQQLRSRYYLLAIIGETLTKLYTNLSDKSMISFTPQFSDGNIYPHDTLVAFMKPTIKQIITFIVAYDGDQPVFSFYNNPDCLQQISTSVETNIASVRALEETDRQFTEFGNMLCNG